jgi:RNA polymerase sigma factor for flagellar operon FliA
VAKIREIFDDLEWARAYSKVCASRFLGLMDQDDLQSAGIVAFLGAATRFDVSRGIPFRGFCASRIRGAIIDEVRRWGWAPRSFYRNHHLLESARASLLEELEREPTFSELGLKLGLAEESVRAMRAAGAFRQIVTWDERAGEEGSENLAERVADENCVRPDARILSAEEKRELLACIARLPRIQAFVVVLHYLKDVPLGDVAKATGLTASRISQLHRQALDRLKLLWNSTR